MQPFKHHAFCMEQLFSAALLQLSKKEKNPNKRIRLLAISLFLESQNRSHVARQLKVARGSVNHWVSEYLSKGVSGLDDKPRKGRIRALSPRQEQQLARYIDKQQARPKHYSHLMSVKILCANISCKSLTEPSQGDMQL